MGKRKKRRGLQVRRGDTVEVISGNARGARGRILRAMPRARKVVVEGVNLRWKHMRATRQGQQGGRVSIEAPMDASNVMLICPNGECERANRPVRTRSAVTDEGRKIRVCAKCGAEIPTAE
ncbi:MAG: 50S ribosomal protein L24 [Planctomycetes bacterium]|nr:50S ribosomal protein L24 [Planctomycetota bacterium]